MNKWGQNFKEERISIPLDKLRHIMEDIKDIKSLAELARKLNVSYQTLQHDWLIKGNTLPLSIFRRILKLNGKVSFNELKKSKTIKILPRAWGQKFGAKYYKEINIPKKNNQDFAEFYGIMLGDGCIYSNLSGLCISGDKILDRDHHNYISKLIWKLFKTKSNVSISKKTRSIRTSVYSKHLTKYLIKNNFPKGKKLDNELKIPNFLFQNPLFIARCIRGLFDTDGSISSHPHSKIMIHLSITSKSLRDSVFNGLLKLGILGGKYNKGIMIYGSEKVNDFFKIIGTSNNKNKIKYNHFIETRKVPSSKETEIFLRDKRIEY